MTGHAGYTIVIWRGRHVAEPTELAAHEAGAYFAEVLRVARAIERHYRPLKHERRRPEEDVAREAAALRDLIARSP